MLSTLLVALAAWLILNATYVVFRFLAGPSRTAPKPNTAYFKRMGIKL